MKKIFKGRSLIAAILLIATIFTSTSTMMTEAASTAPKSFTATSTKRISAYIGDHAPYEFITNSGDYILCNDMHKKNPLDQTMTLVKEATPGITYLIANGFPNKSITGNKEYDSFITRAALWWYLDETTGSNNLSADFKSTAADPHNLRPHIINLVNNAKKVTAYETPAFTLVNSNKTMHLSSDKKYYESVNISATSKNITGNYAVTLTGAPEGTVIVNATSGVSQTSFAPNESFKIRIPVSNMKATTANIKITATATGFINKAYEYTTGNSIHQNMYLTKLYPDTTNLTSTTEVSLVTSKVTIMKIDSKTGKTLAGSKLELIDQNGKKITSWTSTTKAHVIKNLPDGTYILREISAPTGYKLQQEAISIKINDQNRDITIRVENKAITKLVSIVKIDKSTEKPLSGAHLIVKNEKGETIADFTTTEDPYTITKLEDGTYTVEELSAPNGFKKTDEVYKFTISDETPSAQIVVENYPEVIVPDTNSSASIFTVMLGLMIIASGVGIVHYNGKKQQ